MAVYQISRVGISLLAKRLFAVFWASSELKGILLPLSMCFYILVVPFLLREAVQFAHTDDCEWWRSNG